MPGKSGTNAKFGRNAAKCKEYKASHRLERHKVKRVLQSNGVAAAHKYAVSKGLTGYLDQLILERKK
jgi:hypothetical protein